MAQPPLQNTMPLAEILSDLVSLRVCEPAAALALVSASPQSTSKADAQTVAPVIDEQDADLKRAQELVQLHYDVRERYRRGEGRAGLEEARSAVGRAVGG